MGICGGKKALADICLSVLACLDLRETDQTPTERERVVGGQTWGVCVGLVGGGMGGTRSGISAQMD